MRELSPEQVTDLIRHWDVTLDDPTADYPDSDPSTDPSTDSDVCWADAPTASDYFDDHFNEAFAPQTECGQPNQEKE